MENIKDTIIDELETMLIELRIKMVTIDEKINNIINNPTTSYFLKDILEKSKNRDIVDTLYDLECALRIIKDKWNFLTGGDTK